MKQVLNSSLAVILITAMVNTASAQGGGSNAQPQKVNFDKNSVDLKESSNSSAFLSPMNSADVNKRAAKDFAKSFKNAASAIWYPNGKGFTVRFQDNGTKTSAEYDKKGNWKSTVSYYGEDKMSKELRKQIKSTYFDYKINQVIEIHTLDGSGFIVQLEDEKSFLNIRVVEGEMDVYGEIRKQK